MDFDEHVHDAAAPPPRRATSTTTPQTRSRLSPTTTRSSASRSRELEARRSRDPTSPATLDAQRLQLELRRLTRRLNAARQAGEPGVTELAAEREQLQAKLNDAIERVMSTS